MVDELKTVRVYRCRLRDFGISCDVDVSGERLTWSFSSKRIGSDCIRTCLPCSTVHM
jgi:hypothetical protein